MLSKLEIFQGCLYDLENYNKLLKSHHSCLWMDCYYIYLSNRECLFPRRSSIHCNRKELTVANCDFGNGGRGVNVVLLPHDIETLIVWECDGTSTCLVDTIKLNCLNRLSKLDLYQLPEVEFLLRLSTLGDHCSSLQALLELQINLLPELIGLVKREELGAFGILSQGNFSYLRVFSIQSCKKIKKLIPVWLLQNLQNLENIQVIDCSKLEEIIAEDDDASRPDSTSSGTISVTLPMLKILRLAYLLQLSSIYDGSLFCDSVEKIEIFECPNLKRLPFHLLTTANGKVSGSRALEHILGSDEWWEDLGAFGNLSRGTFSCLRIFSLQGCNKIKKLFPVWLLQNLEQVYISECYKLQGIFAEDEDAGRPNSTTSIVTFPKLKF